jgi:hypothetical protein
MWNKKTVSVVGAVIMLGLLSPGQTYAQAPAPTTKDQSMTSDFDGDPTSPCTGESVTVHGKTTILSKVNSSNGNTNVTMITHNQGTGLGDTSSAKYEYSDFDETKVVCKSNEHGPSYLKRDFITHLVRQKETTDTTGANGGGDDWFTYSKTTFQLTNCGAVTAVQRNQERQECR